MKGRMTRPTYDQLAAFARAIIRQHQSALGDVDGGSIQDAAERHGVLVAVRVTEPCGEYCRCVDYADFPMECYRLHPGLREANDA